MLKQQVEPYKRFAQNYYIDRDTAHDFRTIERIISHLDYLSQGVASPVNKALLYFLACFNSLEKNLSENESFRDRVRVFLNNLE